MKEILVFRAKGKLLISGEYLVLDGAKALAIPTKLGQHIVILPLDTPILKWESKDMYGHIWFSSSFDIENEEVIKSTDSTKAEILLNIFREIIKSNPSFKNELIGRKIKSFVDFSLNWGLGTSSTLISCMAQYGNVNPFDLQKKIFGGSGYDIACATTSKPIFYLLNNNQPSIQVLDFYPSFSKKLFFVYLDKKRNSRDAIKSYQKAHKPSKKEIELISGFSDKFVLADNLTEFQDTINLHESVISNILGEPTVKSSLFPNFNGAIKSLGAWGGDFVLVASNLTKKETKLYFIEKGYKTVIPYKKMVF